jgi:hypothetical protein
MRISLQYLLSVNDTDEAAMLREDGCTVDSEETRQVVVVSLPVFT